MNRVLDFIFILYKNLMNFFGNDLMKGVINAMSNNNGWNNGNEKENALRNSLEYCTYPDE